MSIADRQRFLANADADAGRLALLVTRLLDLARADMAAPGDERCEVDTVVAQSADAWRSDNFMVDVALPPHLPIVAVPAGTLEAALATLFENSHQAGAAVIYVRGVVTSIKVILIVSDDGSGVMPADRARLFEPFFTTRRDQGCTGLGLAIARSLLEAAGGTLMLVEDSPMTFSIGMPIA